MFKALEVTILLMMAIVCLEPSLAHPGTSRFDVCRQYDPNINGDDNHTPRGVQRMCLLLKEYENRPKKSPAARHATCEDILAGPRDGNRELFDECLKNINSGRFKKDPIFINPFEPSFAEEESSELYSVKPKHPQNLPARYGAYEDSVFSGINKNK